MPPEPRLDVRAGGNDPKPVLAGMCQRGADQRVAYALTLARRRNFGMLEVEHVVTKGGVDELRVPVGKRDDEAGLLGIVADGHAASREGLHGE